MRQGDEVGERLALGAIRRIELEQQLAGFSEVRRERRDFTGEEIGFRSSDDHDSRVVWHRTGLREHELVDRVVLVAECVGDAFVAVALARRGVFLAVSLREVDLLRPALHDLDDGGRDVLLGVGRDALAAVLVLQQNRSVRLHLVLRGDGRLLVGIDVVGGHLARDVLVFLELVPITLHVVLLREHHDVQRRVELLQDGACLVRETELLGGREVPPLVLPRADVVDGDENAEDHERADDGQRAVAGLAAREQLRDVAPLAEDVDEQADEAGVREVGRVLILRRIAEADRHGGEYRRKAQPADESDDSIQHG